MSPVGQQEEKNERGAEEEEEEEEAEEEEVNNSRSEGALHIVGRMKCRQLAECLKSVYR